MTNPTGTKHETDIVNRATEAGFPAQRMPKYGARDRGDIHLHDGDGTLWVIEAKNRKGYDLPTAMKQLAAEKANAGAERGVAVIKRNGVGDVGRSFVVMELDDWLETLPRPY